MPTGVKAADTRHAHTAIKSYTYPALPTENSGPLGSLLKRNQEWAARKVSGDKEYFSRLSNQQNPEYLWIGCSDSRVSANVLLGLEPGEVFVHRNVGNLVLHTDFNCLSVLQYAVEVLKVKHVVVTGHYGCGAVRTSMTQNQFGLIDHWLRNLKDIYIKYQDTIDQLSTDSERVDLLTEINVREQVAHVAQTTIIQNAWKRGQQVSITGLIYSIHDGYLRDIGLTVTNVDQIDKIYDYLPPQGPPGSGPAVPPAIVPSSHCYGCESQRVKSHDYTSWIQFGVLSTLVLVGLFRDRLR